MASSRTRVKVLYIAGFEHSGSTVLTKVLGEIEGAFAAGELRSIWSRSFGLNQHCGCGSPFSECAIWKEVIDLAFGGVDAVESQWMVENRPSRRDTPLMLIPGGDRFVKRRFARYIDTLDRLYSTIADVTASRIIIDSSKTPLYGHVLRFVPSVDLYVVHLVRDPRGTLHSSRRAYDRHHHTEEFNFAKNSILWNLLHVTQEVLGRSSKDRYLRLRYEDFVRDPQGTIGQIQALLGEPELRGPAMEQEAVLLNVNHTVSGNRNRVETGAVPLRLDERWRSELDTDTQSLVRRLTYPFMRHYGYVP